MRHNSLISIESRLLVGMPFYVVAHLHERGQISADLLNYLIEHKIVFYVSAEIEDIKKSFGSTSASADEHQVKLQPTLETEKNPSQLEPDPELIVSDHFCSEQAWKQSPVINPEKQLPDVPPISTMEHDHQQTEASDSIEPAASVHESIVSTPPKIESAPPVDDLHAKLCAMFLPKNSDLNQIDTPRAQSRPTRLSATGNWLFGGAIPKSSSDIQIVESSSSQSVVFSPTSNAESGEPVTKRLRFDVQNGPDDAAVERTNLHRKPVRYTMCQSCKTRFPENNELKRQQGEKSRHCGACRLNFFRTRVFKKPAEKEPPKKRKTRNSAPRMTKPKEKGPRTMPATQQVVDEPTISDGPMSSGQDPMLFCDLNPDGPPFSDDFIIL